MKSDFLYSYKDWENDKMDVFRNMPQEYSHLNGMFLLGANRLDDLCYKYNMISEEDLKKIRQNQENTWDMSVELEREYRINEFLKNYLKTGKKYYKEMLKQEIKSQVLLIDPGTPLNSKERTNFQIIERRVLDCKKGKKDFYLIKGSTYLKVKNKFEEYKSGKHSTPCSLPGHLHRYKAILEYIEYLEKYKSKNYLSEDERALLVFLAYKNNKFGEIELSTKQIAKDKISEVLQINLPMHHAIYKATELTWRKVKEDPEKLYNAIRIYELKFKETPTL